MKEIKHSPELERLVLMQLMHIGNHNDSRCQKALLSITTDCFYNLYHQQILALIRNCFNNNQSFGLVDILMLIPHHQTELHETHSWIMEQYNETFTGMANFDAYVNRLIAMNIIRKQMDVVTEMTSQVNQIADPADAQFCLMDHITQISNLSFRESKDGISNIELAEQYFEGKLRDDLIIPTTCGQLNDLLGGGIMSKSLITVAAGAGVGKTGFAIWLMDVIARNQLDSQSLFFSLEMESKHIWMRHAGICGGIQFDKMSEQQRNDAIVKSSMIPVKIYDCSTTRMANDIDFIITTARLKAAEKPISVIVVDYLGLVQNRGSFERNDLKQADITTKLANLALELNCIVVALSQINRSASARAKDDQCPYPSDAADSSGSHRSSTLWFGVDRPELYQDDPSYINQFVIKCRKNRFGGIFEMVMAFNDATFSAVNQHYFRKPYAKKTSLDEDFYS